MFCAHFPLPLIVSSPPHHPNHPLCTVSLPLTPSHLSCTGTLLHRADLWHAPAPSLPRPGLDGLLLGLCVLLVRPIQFLLQITPGASHGAPEELTCAELAAESVEREALAALLLLKGLLHFFGRIALVHEVVEHWAKQPGDLVNLRLHLWHQPPEPAEREGGGKEIIENSQI